MKLIILIISFITSIGAVCNYPNIAGEYVCKQTDSYQRLVLNSDNTFLLEAKNYHGLDSIKGKWIIINSEVKLLQFDSTDKYRVEEEYDSTKSNSIVEMKDFNHNILYESLATFDFQSEKNYFSVEDSGFFYIPEKYKKFHNFVVLTDGVGSLIYNRKHNQSNVFRICVNTFANKYFIYPTYKIDTDRLIENDSKDTYLKVKP
jgi:hypothetical protein